MLAILGFLFYFLIKEVELASTPISVKATNLTQERLKIYYLSFYEYYEPTIRFDKLIKPNQSAALSFEIEGASELWLVAVDENNVVRFVNKVTEKLQENRAFLITKLQDLTPGEIGVTYGLIKLFWIERMTEYILVMLNVTMLALFFRKKSRSL